LGIIVRQFDCHILAISERQGKRITMNWDAIGAIGELISAFAVLATLIYLAIQVRHNSQQVWSQNMHSRTNQGHKIMEIQSRPHITKALSKAMENEHLSKEESIQMESYAGITFSTYANEFEHARAGINASKWEDSRNLLSYYLAIPWIKKWWLEVGHLATSSDFKKEVESIIAENRGDVDYYNRINEADT